MRSATNLVTVCGSTVAHEGQFVARVQQVVHHLQEAGTFPRATVVWQHAIISTAFAPGSPAKALALRLKALGVPKR
jgi:hypothetical protein